jgi:hypothetical protein
MRLNPYLRLIVATLVLFPRCFGETVIDRVALVIDKKVFTQTEVLDELRITEFLNDQPLDLGPAARRAAAERLVDQDLLRSEMELTGFAPPSAAEADAALRSFRQQRFPSLTSYHAGLEKYGITEEQLKQHLLWQLTVIRFTDYRFRSNLPATNSESADRGDETANSIDEQLDAWLKQARANARITFKQEAFQ